MKELFQKKLKDRGYKVIHLFPVLHEGWEMDNWAAVVERDGTVKLAQTNHGSLELVVGPGAIAEVECLIRRYEQVLNETRMALWNLPKC
jgi:hypothetical protein